MHHQLTALTLLAALASCTNGDTDTDTDTDPDTVAPETDCTRRGSPQMSERDIADCVTDPPFLAYAKRAKCFGGTEWGIDNQIMGELPASELVLVGIDDAHTAVEMHHNLGVRTIPLPGKYTRMNAVLQVDDSMPFEDGATTQLPCDATKWALALGPVGAHYECFVLDAEGWGDVSDVAPDYADCEPWAWYDYR